MKRLLITIALVAGCGTAPKAKPEPEPLITRQSEPLVQRPQRTAGTPFEVVDDLWLKAETLLRKEAESMEVDSVTGVRWADGTETLFVAHVRFPPHDMSEAEYERVVDQDALDRCEAEFGTCIDSRTCAESAYDACIGAAYRDRFVFMSAHHGIDCGVYELSKFTKNGDDLSLADRRIIDTIVCDFDLPSVRPTGDDLDHDGGPELVFTWSSNEPVVREDGEIPRKTGVVVFDANTLEEQLRWEPAVELENYEELNQYHGLEAVKREDGFMDLRASSVRTVGYCLESGWALGTNFVRPTDGPDDEGCEVTATQHMLRYDLAADVWIDPQQESKEAE